jgi:hypothetical protein
MRSIFLITAGALLTAGPLLAQPVASFSLSRTKVCDGSMVLLSNGSTGANSFKWFVEDTLYSVSMNDSVAMQVDNWDLQSVRLVAANTITGLSDTLTKLVEVFGAAAMHLTGDFTNCIGDTISLQAHPEAIAQDWTITPPHQLIAGCDTCSSVRFVLHTIGTTVDLSSTYDGGCAQLVSFHYMMCNPVTTSAAGPALQHAKLYPNPVTDDLYIDAGPGLRLNSISICSAAGIVVYSVSGKDIRIADLSSLPCGLYFVKLHFQEGVITERIVKQ